MERLLIQRIPLNTPGYCSHACVEMAAKAFGVEHICQENVHHHVAHPKWGTEPQEMVKMALDFLPADHILARQNWTFQELTELLDTGQVVVILDIEDNLQRVSKKTGLPINDVDGHYVILAEIAGRTEA